MPDVLEDSDKVTSQQKILFPQILLRQEEPSLDLVVQKLSMVILIPTPARISLRRGFSLFSSTAAKHGYLTLRVFKLLRSFNVR